MERANREIPGRPPDAAPPPPAPSRRGAVTAAAVVGALALALLGAAAWDGTHVRAGEDTLTERDRNSAADAVRGFLTISAHLRSTGGDPRFAERLPADDRVVGELLRELEFLRHAGRTEEARLVRAEIRDVRAAGEGIATVLTKEYWITRDVALRPPVQQPVRSDVVLARYDVRREAGGWRVASWQVDMDPDAPGAAGGTER